MSALVRWPWRRPPWFSLHWRSLPPCFPPFQEVLCTPSTPISSFSLSQINIIHLLNPSDDPWPLTQSFLLFWNSEFLPLESTNCGSKIVFSIHGWESMDVECWLFYTILCKGLEHPWIMVSAGGPGGNLPQTQRDDCIHVFSCFIFLTILEYHRAET